MVEDDRRLGDAVVVVVVTAAANAASLLKDEQRTRTDPVSIDRGRDFTKRGDFFGQRRLWRSHWMRCGVGSMEVDPADRCKRGSTTRMLRWSSSGGCGAPAGRPAGLGRRRAASSTCARVTRQ